MTDETRLADQAGDDAVGDDPDSTAEGIPRPSLAGIPDDTPADGEAEPFELPEIVPATQDPAPREPPPPPEPPASGPSEPTWRAYVSAVPASVSRPVVDLRTPGRRPRVRRVTRVVRHVDPWSVFKIGLIFSLVAYVSLLTSGVLLWRVAEATGTIDNVERWFLQFGWETFEFKGDEIFDNAWKIGLFGVVAMTGALVLLATLFNLVSDIVGGVRVTVLEEEVVERTLSSSRRFVVRRPPVVTPPSGAVAGDWSVDDAAPSDGPPAARPPVTVPGDWSVDD